MRRDPLHSPGHDRSHVPGDAPGEIQQGELLDCGSKEYV